MPIASALRWPRTRAQLTGALRTSRPSASRKTTWQRCARSFSAPTSAMTSACSSTSRSARRWKMPEEYEPSFEHYAKGNSLRRARRWATTPTAPPPASAAVATS